jgi:hypothetical protein
MRLGVEIRPRRFCGSGLKLKRGEFAACIPDAKAIANPMGMEK